MAATYRHVNMKALARYQIILLGEQRHIGVNNLPQGRCPTMQQQKNEMKVNLGCKLGLSPYKVPTAGKPWVFPGGALREHSFPEQPQRGFVRTLDGSQELCSLPSATIMHR